MKTFLINFSIIIFSIPLSGQQWTNFTFGNYVEEVLADGNFMWVASRGGGLIRYNYISGNSTFYNKANSALPSNFVYGLTKAPNGNIWAATRKGIVRIQPATWTVWNSGEPPFDENTTFIDLVFDNSNNLWAGSGSDGLFRFDGNVWGSVSADGIPLQYTRCIASGPDGSLWVGTSSDGLLRKKNENWTIFNTQNSGLPSNAIRDIQAAGQTVWVATANGAAKFSNNEWMVYNTANTGISMNSARSVLPHGSTGAWIGAAPGNYNEGGTLVHITGNSIAAFNQSNSNFSGSIFRSLTITQNGNLWGGSYGDGIFEFDGDNPNYFSVSNCGLPSKTVSSIAVDFQNNKWFGTPGGLAKYNGKDWSVFDEILPGLGFPQVNDLKIAPDGTLWAATTVGLVHYDGNEFYLFNANNTPLPSSHIKDLTISKTGVIWLKTLNGYLVKFESPDWTVFASPFLQFSSITAMTTSNEGDLWAALYEYENSKFYFTIGHLDGENWTTYQTSRYYWGDNIPALIQSMTFNEAGQLFIGTFFDGLYIFENGNWTRKDTTYFFEPVEMEFDENRNLLWAATYRAGLYSFDGANWTRYHEGNSGLSYDYLLSLAIDKNGDIWTGNEVTGVDVFSSDGWTETSEVIPGFNSQLHISPPFPNPFLSTSHYSYSLFSKEMVEAILYDVGSGKVFILESGLKNPGNYSLDIEGSRLLPGLYFLEIKIGNRKKTFKLVKI